MSTSSQKKLPTAAELHDGRASSAESDRNSIDLVVCVRNPVELHGLTGLGRQLGRSVIGFEQDLPRAVAVARRGRRLLVVALRDVDEDAREELRSATEAGTAVLVLVDELDQLARLSGVRCRGFAWMSSINAASLDVIVTRVMSGEVVMPPEVAHYLVESVSQSSEPERAAGHVRLTPREQEALVLLVKGLSNKQIATRLGVSGHGAKRLVANIMAKMDCPNRTAVVAKALQLGIYE